MHTHLTQFKCLGLEDVLGTDFEVSVTDINIIAKKKAVDIVRYDVSEQ